MTRGTHVLQTVLQNMTTYRFCLSSAFFQISDTCTSSMYACTYRLFAGMWRPLASVITTFNYATISFSSSSVVSRAFSALCVHSKFGHNPHPLGYLCVKFHFFLGFHCRASPRRKPHTQSLSQSLTHPAYLMHREPKLMLRKIQLKYL